MAERKSAGLLDDEEVETAILSLVDQHSSMNQSYRDRVLRQDRKAQLYWEGVENIWWSDSAKDYREFSDLSSDEIEELDLDDVNDRNVNIYKAHGEAIIAAMSAQVPGIIWFPDDAQDTDDRATAKSYTTIADLIRRHNRFGLKFVKALYILFNQEYVAAHIRQARRPEFGVERTPQFEKQTESRDHSYCPSCDSNLDDMQGQEEVQCPVCQENVAPVLGQEEEEIDQLVGYKEENKRRVEIEFFGSLHVEIPAYARTQRELPFLTLRTDESLSRMIDKYEHLREAGKLDWGSIGDRESDSERSTRRILQEDQSNNESVAVEQHWIRNWDFWSLQDDDEKVLKLKEMFPNGVRATFVGDVLAEVVDENMDDHWVICPSPLSNTLQGQAIGRSLIPIQEMKSELLELGLQTIEFGIPMLFADPQVVGFDAFKQSRANPGSMYPAQAPVGGDIKSALFETRPTTLSKEVNDLSREMDQAGQFAVGSFPSIYGGTISGGSKTAKEYTESKSMALQRLSTIWKMVSYWSIDVMSLAIKIFLEDLKKDEKFVKREQRNFVNVWIKKAELQGKVGDAEPESSDQFPISWAQRRDMLVELLTLGNPELLQAAFAPQNLPIMSEALGFPHFYIPGEDDRAKQWSEINELIQSQAIDMGDGNRKSSVGIEPFVDNHAVQADICRSFLLSDQGIDLKANNLEGYNNVLVHMLEHEGAQEALESQSTEETDVNVGES
jgi:hypothetical protein